MIRQPAPIKALKKHPPLVVLCICAIYIAIAILLLVLFVPRIGDPTFSTEGVLRPHDVVAGISLCLVFAAIMVASALTMSGSATARIWLTIALATIPFLTVILGIYADLFENIRFSSKMPSAGVLIHAIFLDVTSTAGVWVVFLVVLLLHYWLLFGTQPAKRYFAPNGDA